MDHLFIHYFFSRELWFSQPFRMHWCVPNLTTNFFRQWENSWRGSRLQTISKWALPHFGWGIWKEHNNWIFRDANLITRIVFDKIQNFLLENYMFIKGTNPFSGDNYSTTNTQTRRNECYQSLSLKVDTKPTLMAWLKETKERQVVEE